MKTIILTRQAAKDFDALPLDAQKIVDENLTTYAMTGAGNVKKLSGRAGYRLKFGPYRVLFDEDAKTILAVYIGRRTTTTYR